MRDDDSMLMRQLKRGKITALASLVEKYKKKAYFLALGMVGNADDAYDLSQEAFLRVYQSAKTFDDSKRFFPWFYAILTNLCRTFLKKRSSAAEATVDLDDVEYMLADTVTPESVALAKDEKRMLVEALNTLSFEDREIIVLSHFRMLSYSEISELLHIPKGTVMSRLFYARKRLAKLLSGE
jgi:RNA polymerase sigma-70 factor (ECF subfamily)